VRCSGAGLPCPSARDRVLGLFGRRAAELYAPGEAHDDLPLTAVIRRFDDSPDAPPVRENYVDFIYGTCDTSAGGCAPPLSVQVWAACERNPMAYRPDEAEGSFDVRGVPAYFFEGGRRLEDLSYIWFQQRPYEAGIVRDLRAIPGRTGAARRAVSVYEFRLARIDAGLSAWQKDRKARALEHFRSAEATSDPLSGLFARLHADACAPA
jgi:hypothetical protein